jgi:hypothetical protein
VRTSFSLQRRSYYPWLFLILALSANAAVYFLLYRNESIPQEALMSTIGFVAAFVHFLYSQHNHNTERFVGLFRDFNARYDGINDELNRLLLRDADLLLTSTDKQLLYDYFNLCAEEYLYFKSGYIDSEVWLSWLKGMKLFISDAKIRELWQKEIDSGSYYGFTLALIEMKDS